MVPAKSLASDMYVVTLKHVYWAGLVYLSSAALLCFATYTPSNQILNSLRVSALTKSSMDASHAVQKLCSNNLENQTQACTSKLPLTAGMDD